MTKINDVEANLEQFKSETLAWQKETSNRFDRMQATIEKNKVESDQQFAEIMRMLKTLQPATTVVTDTTTPPSYHSATTIPPPHPTQSLISKQICLSPNNMTYFEEDEKEFENTRSVKEDKDEQGKEEKGVVNSFEVGTDEENNNFDIVLNSNDTWADAGLNHGSYLLLNRIVEDGWYFLVESGLSKEPLCRSNLEVHLQFHVDRLEIGSQVKTWDPGITGGGMWNQHLEDKDFVLIALCLFKKERVPLTERKTPGIDSQWPMRKTSPLFLLFFFAFGLFDCPTQYLKIEVIVSLGERRRSSPFDSGGLPPLRLMRTRFSRRERSCAESNLLRFFSVAEKRSLPPAFKNDEYEVREAAGTMDPLTPNRVAFPGLAGVACRS
ncbi:hypothetical protein Tco_0736254 [Tanacetum coccineum]